MLVADSVYALVVIWGDSVKVIHRPESRSVDFVAGKALREAQGADLCSQIALREAQGADLCSQMLTLTLNLHPRKTEVLIYNR